MTTPTTIALETAIREQLIADRTFGTCSVAEACWTECPDFSDFEEFLTEQEKQKLIAICGVVNTLDEMVSDILEKAKKRKAEEKPLFYKQSKNKN